MRLKAFGLRLEGISGLFPDCIVRSFKLLGGICDGNYIVVLKNNRLDSVKCLDRLFTVFRYLDFSRSRDFNSLSSIWVRHGIGIPVSCAARFEAKVNG